MILFILVNPPIQACARACVSREWQSLSLCMWELIRLSVQSYPIMKSSGWDIIYSVRQGPRAREVFNGSSAQQQEIMTIWQTSVRTDIHPSNVYPSFGSHNICCWRRTNRLTSTYLAPSIPFPGTRRLVLTGRGNVPWCETTRLLLIIFPRSQPTSFQPPYPRPFNMSLTAMPCTGGTSISC